MTHLDKEHPEQLWEDFEDAGPGADEGENDSDASDPAFEQPAPYVGKGKGRA